MNKQLHSEPDSPEGATAVIKHQVRFDRHADYEAWVKEIAPLAKAAPGHLDWHIVRPVPGRSETFTVIVRFDTDEHLMDWMNSPTRASLIEKVQPLLVSGDGVHISSGLDFWFSPPSAKAAVPVRWKQFLVTWSAIYPLVLAVTLIMTPLMKNLGLPQSQLLVTLAVTGVVVYLMVYAVMPWYTKLVQRWLFD
ncbi:antibiotic biosynthesis monooxygenase [Parahaliea maris]|uniref:Antibiotic biosynthesis monooxygenase n=1 Tax=Parahaliea maris TaxID=2716870 RepID=A0A5C8ZZF3_9GAMM|nr:antibiotic biosynthesis monooxygenase [Parahaliea maris]TXS92910.1 antibiotic biosynthesis monooxygenase [Parahaliea maris]